VDLQGGPVGIVAGRKHLQMMRGEEMRPLAPSDAFVSSAFLSGLRIFPQADLAVKMTADVIYKLIL
jgi:hypothetical protein